MRTMSRHLLIGLYCFFLAVADVLSSMAVAILIVAASLGWGVFEMFVPRARLPPCVRAAVNTWSYGQILLMLLLVLPFWSTFQQLLGKRRVLEAFNLVANSCSF